MNCKQERDVGACTKKPRKQVEKAAQKRVEEEQLTTINLSVDKLLSSMYELTTTSK